MTSIESTRSAILEFLSGYTSGSSSVVARLKNAVVQKDTDEKLINTLLDEDDENIDYGMSLKQYTNLNSYLAVMDSLYGNRSASSFKNALNNVLNAGKNSQITNAKTFIQKMKENGLSTSSATKMYRALNSYSIVSNMQTSSSNLNSFLSAKI